MKDKVEKIKYTLVTGGSRGIGSAICVQLAKDSNYKSLINYRGNEQAAKETLAKTSEDWRQHLKNIKNNNGAGTDNIKTY